MKKWLSEGVLFTEGDPAVYVYYQDFTYAGTTYTRRGFPGPAAGIALWRKGRCFPTKKPCPAQNSTA